MTKPSLLMDVSMNLLGNVSMSSVPFLICSSLSAVCSREKQRDTKMDPKLTTHSAEVPVFLLWCSWCYLKQMISGFFLLTCTNKSLLCYFTATTTAKSVKDWESSITISSSMVPRLIFLKRKLPVASMGGLNTATEHYSSILSTLL